MKSKYYAILMAILLAVGFFEIYFQTPLWSWLITSGVFVFLFAKFLKSKP